MIQLSIVADEEILQPEDAKKLRRSCLSRNETERAGQPTNIFLFRGSLSASTDFKLQIQISYRIFIL